VALCSLGLFGVYGLSIMGLSRMATPGAKASVVFGPDAPDSAIFSLSLKISAVVATLILAFILPGFIWVLALWPAGKDVHFSRIVAWAFPLNVALLIAATTIFKIVSSSPLARSSFLGLDAAVVALGLILAARKAKGNIRFRWSFKSAVPYIAFGFATLLCLGVFSQEMLSSAALDTALSGGKTISGDPLSRWDLDERFGLAQSLKAHLLPHWHLEYADRFGFPVVNPPLHSYFNLFALLFLGDAFGAVSITSVAFIYVASLVALSIVLFQKEDALGQEPGGQSKKVALGSQPAVLILVITIFGYFFLHESDPSTIVFPTHLFVLTLLLTFGFLIKGEFRLFVVYALLAALFRYAGVLVISVGLFFHLLLDKASRRPALRAYGEYLALLVLFFVFILCASAAQGNLAVFLETVKYEVMVRFDHFGLIGPPPSGLTPEPKVTVANTISFLNWFLYGPVFLSIFFFLPKKDKIARLFSFTFIAYFLIILASRNKRVHYVTPFVFTAAIVAARTFLFSKRKLIWVAVYIAAVFCGLGWIWISGIAAQRINVALDPDSSAVRYKLALAYKDRGMLGRAQRELQRIISRDPDDTDALMELGECYLIQGRYKEAEDAFNRILKIYPNHRPARGKLEEIRSLRSGGDAG